MIDGSHLLVSVGRTPNTHGIGLDLAGVELDSRGYVKVNERLETTAPGVWVMGECAGSPQFTHVAFDDFRVVRDNLAGRERTTRDRLVPFCMFTDPELARVGMNESAAQRAGIPYRIAKLPMTSVLRARSIGETRGFMKALIDTRSDRLLGFTMLGAEAGEVVAVVQTAMLAGLPYTGLRDAIFTHPTMAEGLNVLFNLKKDCITCLENGIDLQPDEFDIDEIHRFEGMTDPGDENILFAISSARHNLKGTLVNAFGVYADTASAELIARLNKRKIRNRGKELVMATTKTFTTRIDLAPETREKMIALLNQQLADTFDLYSQIKQAHWNVKGAQFFQLHELFDKLAEEVEEYVDLIAERVTALGGVALGTARMSSAASRLPEFPVDVVDSLPTVEALATRYANLAATTRAAIDASAQQGDVDTSDLFTEVSRRLDKALWFLEAHLQK